MPKVIPNAVQRPMNKFQQPNRGVMRGNGMKPVRRQQQPEQSRHASIPKIDWSNLPLKEFRKNFLPETPVCKYSDEAITNYYARNEARTGTRMRAQKGHLPVPVDPIKLRCPFFEISETPFPPALHDLLREEGFEEPSPIQAISWPYILSGQNFAGVAQCNQENILHTFVLPAIVHVADRIENAKAVVAGNATDSCGPYALILTYVKKRGEVIQDMLKKYGASMNVTNHLIFGGHEKKSDDDPVELGLKDNPHIIVAALGQKLADLLMSKKLSLKRCSFLVLDDGCRLVKNNANYLKDVLGQIRPDRQIVMWTSAFSTVGTETTAVKILQSFNFTDYVRLYFGSFGHYTDPNSIKHVVLPVKDTNRQARFIWLIQTILTAASAASTKKPKTLIFCNSPDRLSRLTFNLLAIGLLSRQFIKPKTPETDATANANKTDEAATEMAEQAVDDSVVTEEDSNLTPRELNEKNMRENPNQHFWVTHSATPLTELNFADFDFIINYEFPLDNFVLFEQRVIKLKEESGKGTIYTFFVDTDGPKAAKYLANHLQVSNQYVPAKLHEIPTKTTAPNTPVNQSPMKPGGIVPRNRPSMGPPGPSPRGGPGFRAAPYPGGNFGRPNFPPNDRRMGGPGPQRSNPNFGRFANNNGRGASPWAQSGPPRGGSGPRNFGPAFNPGPPINDDMGATPDVLDALQLLTQLRNKVNSTPMPPKIDVPFYRQNSPPRDDFNERRPFNRFGNTSTDFSSDNQSSNFGGGFSSSFLSDNSSRNQFGGGFNNKSGGGGGRGAGNNWSNDKERRQGNFSNWNNNF